MWLGPGGFPGPPVSETPTQEKPLLGTLLGSAVTVQVAPVGDSLEEARWFGGRCGATRSDLVSPFSCSPGKTAVLEPECRQVSFLGPSLHRGWVGGDQPMAVVSNFSLRTHCVCFKTKTRGTDTFHVWYPKRECVCSRPRQLRALTTWQRASTSAG